MIFEAMTDPQIAFLILGIIAALFNITSYQIKKQSTYLIFQIIMTAILVSQYSVAAAWAAVMLNSLAACRAIAFYLNKDDKKRGKILGIIFAILNVVAIVLSCVFFKEFFYMGIVIGVAQVVGTIALGSTNNRIVKLAQLFVVSPCWLAYSIFYTCIGFNNVGGIVMESMTIISIIVFFVRTKTFLNKEKDSSESSNE